IRISRQSDTGELPAGLGRKKIAKTAAYPSARGGARTAAQDILIDHRTAVIFSHRFFPYHRKWFLRVWFCRIISRVRAITGSCPFPGIPIKLVGLPAYYTCFDLYPGGMKTVAIRECTPDFLL